jgi:ubiquinone/menaquinone biosynthesis C-methylase UbiE
VRLLQIFILILSASCTTQHHKQGNLNEPFLAPDMDVEKWAKGFEHHERDVIRHRSKIISNLELGPGITVADIGAGTGVFVRALSKAVGAKGRVYAVDISPGFVKHLKTMAKQEGLQNVVVIQGQPVKTNIPENSVDRILVVDTYHHFDHPVEMLQDFKKVLKQQGKLAIVDFDKTPTSREWVQSHVKKTQAEYIAEIEAQGFRLIKDADIPFEENFMLIFEML